MSEVDKAVEKILRHKASLIRRGDRLKKHIHDLLKDLGIDDLAQACEMAAVDAMIYDVACALDFTKQKGRASDWSSYKKRKELILKIWRGKETT